MVKEQSLAMSLIDELKNQNKREHTIKKILIIAWFISELLTVGGFIWYINQFDYNTESTATMETENSGTINTGDINNG